MGENVCASIAFPPAENSRIEIDRRRQAAAGRVRKLEPLIKGSQLVLGTTEEEVALVLVVVPMYKI